MLPDQPEMEQIMKACRLLDACDQLLRERARIVAALADLPASWSNVRKVLNEFLQEREGLPVVG